jgi:hypothetical protein
MHNKASHMIAPAIAPIMERALTATIVMIAIFGVFLSRAQGQTAADTQIQNQASATYSDGSGGNYSTVSNTVTVTVSKVSGLTITPDGAVDANVVPGQTGLLFSFRVTNTSNFSEQVRFLAGGASVYLSPTSPATITRAVIDKVTPGTITGGDTDIMVGSDTLSDPIAQNGFIDVLVEVSVNGGATAGQTVQVFLGDADDSGPAYDNEPSDTSPAEVRTVTLATVNGLREARGDRSVSVENDARLTLNLTAPAGPVPLGSVITYNWDLCNTGARAATAITLSNVTAPPGGDSGVFIIAPIPAGTQLDATQSYPPGVNVLYSTSPLSDNPITTAVWTSAAPPLSTVTRVAFEVGNALGVGQCSPTIDMNVLITTNNANSAINEQGDAYAENYLNQQITAQSPLRVTTLQVTGSVLNGPVGVPGAVGPTDNNDDFTNKSVNTGIADIPPGGATNASGTATFTNTVQNTGNANDTYTLSVPTYPAGADVTVTVNAVPTLVVDDGTPTGNPIPTLSVAFGATANYQVTVTLPAGKVVLTGYDTVIRATSGNTGTASNDTIDRLYTGFVRLDKAYTVDNQTPNGGPTDSVPGAVITFAITYTNVSSSGGVGNVTLTATNLVITEDGNDAPNNWATYTTHVVGATDTLGGTITGDALGSVLLTDTIASLSAGQSGVFSFKRQIQ